MAATVAARRQLARAAARLAEANDCHNPPGTPDGGQFCAKGGAKGADGAGAGGGMVKPPGWAPKGVIGVVPCPLSAADLDKAEIHDFREEVEHLRAMGPAAVVDIGGERLGGSARLQPGEPLWVGFKFKDQKTALAAAERALALIPSPGRETMYIVKDGVIRWVIGGTETSVQIGALVRAAKSDLAGSVMTHNHPSGTGALSEADIAMAIRLGATIRAVPARRDRWGEAVPNSPGMEFTPGPTPSGWAEDTVMDTVSGAVRNASNYVQRITGQYLHALIRGTRENSVEERDTVERANKAHGLLYGRLLMASPGLAKLGTLRYIEGEPGPTATIGALFGREHLTAMQAEAGADRHLLETTER